MKKFLKVITMILVMVTLASYIPKTECHGAEAGEYESATEIELNKLYVWSYILRDEYTNKVNYTWYKFTPKTQGETKIEIVHSVLKGAMVEINIYDSILQNIAIKNNKISLEKDETYYIRISGNTAHMNVWNYSDISFMLKSSPEPENTSNPAASSAPGSQVTSSPVNNKTDTVSPGTNNTPENDNSGSKNENAGSDIGNVDNDFWNENGNNGSDIYDNELPVPEITEIENGSNSVNITWSIENADSVDGYYIYRSKDGKNWDKIATIQDADIEDYEDNNVTNGDMCGYIICSYALEIKSENSVPEFTCFLNKINIKSVKSNASKKLNIKWNANNNSSGYQVRVSTTKSFTKTTTVEIKVNSKSKTSKTINNLKGGKKYYVQARAYRIYNGEVYYSEWSATKSIKVKK